jgi:hypothetical protein
MEIPSRAKAGIASKKPITRIRIFEMSVRLGIYVDEGSSPFL